MLGRTLRSTSIAASHISRREWRAALRRHFGGVFLTPGSSCPRRPSEQGEAVRSNVLRKSHPFALCEPPRR